MTLLDTLRDALRRHLPALRDRRYLAVVFLLALALRVLYNLTVARDYVPAGDATEYIGLAQHMLHWGCYCQAGPGMPTTYRPPVFPLFLAGVFALFGDDPLRARLALSVVGSVTCVLTSEMARTLFGRRAAIVAGLIAATYPQLFIYDAWLYSESLATCLFAASCLATMYVVRRPVGWRWVLVGALLGMTALTRPNGIYALIAVVAWAAVELWRRRSAARRALLGVALVTLGCIAVMTPWTIRNYVVTDGAFVPISTGGGIVLAGSYSTAAYKTPGFRGAWINPLDDPYMDAHDRQTFRSFPLNLACWGPCEVARDDAATHIALGWVGSNLSLLPRLLTLRFQRFWIPAPSPKEAGMPILRPFAEGYPLVVMLLALAGFVALIRRWRGAPALIFCCFGATVIAGALLFYGSPRMRAPLEPFLVTLAAGALVVWLPQLYAWWRAWRAPTSVASGDAPVHADV